MERFIVPHSSFIIKKHVPFIGFRGAVTRHKTVSFDRGGIRVNVYNRFRDSAIEGSYPWKNFYARYCSKKGSLFSLTSCSKSWNLNLSDIEVYRVYFLLKDLDSNDDVFAKYCSQKIEISSVLT